MGVGTGHVNMSPVLVAGDVISMTTVVPVDCCSEELLRKLKLHLYSTSGMLDVVKSMWSYRTEEVGKMLFKDT